MSRTAKRAIFAGNALGLGFLAFFLTLLTARGFSNRQLQGTARPRSSRRRERNGSLQLCQIFNDPLLEQSMDRALTKMQTLMEPGFFKSSYGSLKQLQKKCENIVKADVSSIPGAGLGLFAKMDIPKGKIVSFYPVHGLGVDYGESSLCVGSGVNGDQEYFKGRDNAKSMYLHYLIGSRPLASYETTSLEFPIFIDINPSRPSVPGWLSHYINDGAVVKHNTEHGVLDYYDESRLAKNCIHIPFGPSPIMATVTTRKVKKGEELFTSYGCSYWLEALMEQSLTTGNTGDYEITDITESIQVQVRATAKDLYVGMCKAREDYTREAAYLQNAFESV